MVDAHSTPQKGTSKGRPRGSGESSTKVVDDILQTAHEEFASKGYSGASINEIAEKIQTTKRMIYYHFADKESLYRAVLKAAYEEMRKGESQLQLEGLSPAAGLQRLVEFTFDHHWNSPDFIRLVMIENVHNAGHLAGVDDFERLNTPTLTKLAALLDRGADQGIFRKDISPVELHWHISAACFFNVANRATFSRAFGADNFTPQGQRRLRKQVTEAIVRLVEKKDKKMEKLPSQDSELEPDIVDFLNEWDDRWASCPPNSGPAARRAHFETIAAAMRLPTPKDVDCESVALVPSSHGDVRVRTFKFTRSKSPQPALMYLHGGAFMQGSPETHWDITSRIAAWAQMTVISVDYAKAPEHPFPTALYQCADVIKWMHLEASALGIDASRISWGGDSAGGNLAASLGLIFRGTRYAAHANLLIYPACDFNQNRDSYIENANGPLIKVAGMDAVNKMYCPHPSDLTNPLAAPLLAQDHSGLPPTYVAVAQFDPLRDSGLAYYDALVNAGVKTELDRGERLCHGYLRGMGHAQISLDKLKAMTTWLTKINHETHNRS